MRKTEAIRQQLEKLETHLSNAERYLARNVNIEGSGSLHLDDWQGNSGHPLWVRNVMIPRTLQARAENYKALDTVIRKAKAKAIRNRRQDGKT